jgi:hypothetical protein
MSASPCPTGCCERRGHVVSPSSLCRHAIRRQCTVAFNEFQLGKDVNRISQRLALIEEKLKQLSEVVGVPYEDPADGVPPEVVDLVRNGDRIGAIKLYRELTGASGDDARDVVNGL